jgi:hypothetical protein
VYSIIPPAPSRLTRLREASCGVRAGLRVDQRLSIAKGAHIPRFGDVGGKHADARPGSSGRRMSMPANGVAISNIRRVPVLSICADIVSVSRSTIKLRCTSGCIWLKKCRPIFCVVLFQALRVVHAAHWDGRRPAQVDPQLPAAAAQHVSQAGRKADAQSVSSTGVKLDSNSVELRTPHMRGQIDITLVLNRSVQKLPGASKALGATGSLA